jgi:hypothetical protein
MKCTIMNSLLQIQWNGQTCPRAKNAIEMSAIRKAAELVCMYEGLRVVLWINVWFQLPSSAPLFLKDCRRSITYTALVLRAKAGGTLAWLWKR